MELTYDAAMSGLLRLAAERPEYNHREDPKSSETRTQYMLDNPTSSGGLTCFYRFHDDTPGCIIGALVAELFPDVRLMESELASYVIRRAGIEVSHETGCLLNAVQGEQDDNKPWGRAVPLGIARAKEA